MLCEIVANAYSAVPRDTVYRVQHKLKSRVYNYLCFFPVLESEPGPLRNLSAIVERMLWEES